jgi:hypothetical protein
MAAGALEVPSLVAAGALVSFGAESVPESEADSAAGALFFAA